MWAMKLVISSALIGQIQSLAKDHAPEEVCGVLLGENGHVEQIIRSANVAIDPQRHFEIDPAVLISAERAARSAGPAIIGYFHSHPTGDLSPSQTDADCAAADGRIWLIVNGRQAAAWRAVDQGEISGRFDPITLDCGDTKGQTASS